MVQTKKDKLSSVDKVGTTRKQNMKEVIDEEAKNKKISISRPSVQISSSEFQYYCKP
ncbi:uncharacterized protein G2W53_007461 [Senna tora]|uniref:Uncharacterized protein n=1 Tax=Senna tora TaxID=362788 RepID=A0A835CE92_9FABA|nr:uncharacterized protein G2W53_007461 [Senna tora]